MKKLILLLVFILIIGLNMSEAFALVVTIKTVSSGVYEDGQFRESKDGIEATYEIDETKRTMRLLSVARNDREGKIENEAVYDITNISVSEGLSALMFSSDKKGQKIFTAVREADLGVSEIFIIGENFYEYCRAANAKFYLEYGTAAQH